STGNARVDRILNGMLGAGHLDRVALDGSSIALRFRQDDRYFVNDEFFARLAIGAAFGLLCRCGLSEARFLFLRDGQEVNLRIGKDAFNRFFGLSEEQMTRIASDPARFEDSPVHKIDEKRQWEFYLQFTKNV
ncbi:MAG: hypothetical protein ACHQZQ_02145, partial [SAR324 cluster bacterium]